MGGWIGYKGAACHRCGYPCSPFVLVTDVKGDASQEVRVGRPHRLFEDIDLKHTRKEYLETLEVVFAAVNYLVEEGKFNDIVPTHAKRSSPLTEKTGVPSWMAREMRKALAGGGSDLLVRIIEAAKADSS